MSDKQMPNFISWLTPKVRYSKVLNSNEKILFAELTSLTNKYGYSWASDEFLSKCVNKSPRTVRRYLQNLEKEGFITIQHEYKENSKQIEKRLIRLSETGMDIGVHGYGQDCPKGMDKTDQGGMVKTDQDNNIPISNNIPTNNIHKDNECFDTFWDKYPRKVGKGKAKQSFKKKVTSEEIYQAIMEDLDNRKYDEQWTKDDGKFIPYPATYLNQERWLDEYEKKGQGDERAKNFGYVF